MSTFEVVSLHQKSALINTLPVKRQWMDETRDAHAYHCFPMSTANAVGWYLSFPEDISFIWDGQYNKADAVKILDGEKYAYTGREHQTVSFHTGLSFKTDEDCSIFIYNPQNYFRDDIETISAVVSTSWYHLDLPCAIKIKKPNEVITIKAYEPVAAIIPLSLGNLQKTELNFYNGYMSEEKVKEITEYGEVSQKLNKAGTWTNFYRNATNEKNEPVGKHEVKALRLKINRLDDVKKIN